MASFNFPGFGLQGSEATRRLSEGSASLLAGAANIPPNISRDGALLANSFAGWANNTDPNVIADRANKIREFGENFPLYSNNFNNARKHFAELNPTLANVGEVFGGGISGGATALGRGLLKNMDDVGHGILRDFQGNMRSPSPQEMANIMRRANKNTRKGAAIGAGIALGQNEFGDPLIELLNYERGN